MNAVEIRSANAEDAEKISEIMKSVWPVSSISTERILAVLGDTMHSTMLAVSEDRVVGFVDGFLTVSQDGMERWELDLLAVHPDFQRRGIASALVTVNTQNGQSIGAEIARGLVAVSNVGSQRAFAKSGYETDGVICELMIASGANHLSDTDDMYEGVTIIPVQTINYKGLWVEGKRSKSGLRQAIRQALNSDNDLAGAVIPNIEVSVIDDALSQGYEKVGRYQWWQRPLK